MVNSSIVYLVVFILAVVVAQQKQQKCVFSTPKIEKMKPVFGGLDGFYGIAKGISDGFQGTPDEQTYRNLKKLMFGGGGFQTIKDMFLGQIGTVLFWGIGVVLVLGGIVFAVFMCIYQCCKSCVPKETSVRSDITGYIYAALLFTVFTFILTGLVIFNFAETEMINSVDNGMVYVEQIYSDVNDVLGNGTGQLTCEVTQTTSQTFKNMNALVKKYSENVVDKTKKKVGIDAVNDFPDQDLIQAKLATEDAAHNLEAAVTTLFTNNLVPVKTCTDNLQTLKDQSPLVFGTLQGITTTVKSVRDSQQLKEINTQIQTIRDKVDEQANSASEAIKKTQGEIDKSMLSITEMLTKIHTSINNLINPMKAAHKDFVGGGTWSSMTLGLRLAVTIPACIACCFCILAFVSVFISLKKQDGFAIKASSYVLSAFHSTLTSSITLIVISSLVFIVGWLISAVCVPVFYDSNYQFFHLMNQSISPVGNGTPHIINIGELLQKCESESMTLYKAIDGKKVISADSIGDQINLDTYRNSANEQIMKQPSLTFPMDPTWKDHITNLAQYTQDAKAAVLDACADVDVTAKYNEYIRSLEKSNQLSAQFFNNLETLSKNTPQTTAIAKEENDNYFKQGDKSINESISALLKSLEEKVFMCHPLVGIYENGGFVMCERFGKPIQGLWASVGLAGLFMFFFAILLLLTFRWLKTNSKETAGSGKDMKNGEPKTPSDKKKSPSSEEHSSPPHSANAP